MINDKISFLKEQHTKNFSSYIENVLFYFKQPLLDEKAIIHYLNVSDNEIQRGLFNEHERLDSLLYHSKDFSLILSFFWHLENGNVLKEILNLSFDSEKLINSFFIPINFNVSYYLRNFCETQLLIFFILHYLPGNDLSSDLRNNRNIISQLYVDNEVLSILLQYFSYSENSFIYLIEHFFFSDIDIETVFMDFSHRYSLKIIHLIKYGYHLGGIEYKSKFLSKTQIEIARKIEKTILSYVLDMTLRKKYKKEHLLKI